jgi:outer membrane protein OmpA-like peptidoglycan-associated protein
MVSSGSGGQPRGAGDRVQADCGAESGTSGLRFRPMRAAPAALALLVAGCSSFPSSMNPVSWWHDLQGGKIAEDRPPPPGADQPYPNLSTVPPKPAPPDRAAMANLSAGLIADRTNAQRMAAAAPIADPSSPNASPDLFGKGSIPPPPPAPPPGTATASASLPAKEAPPAPPAPPYPSPGQATAAPGAVPAPAKAPVGAVQSSPLAPPGAAAQPTSEAGAPPPLPTTPPPAANLGAARAIPPAPPPVVTAAPPAAPPVAAAVPPPASPPPVAAPSPPAESPTAAQAAPPSPPPLASPPPAAPATAASTTPPPPPSAANTISVTFLDGSSALPSIGADSLKQLASRRGNGIIAVVGHGEAASNDPDAQSAALALGLSRAQAMATALVSAGVPRSAMQVDAAASGRGGTARLVQ